MHAQPSTTHRRSGARAALAFASLFGLGCSDTSTEVVVDGSHPIYASVVDGLRHLGGGTIPEGPRPVYGDQRWVSPGLGQAHTCGVKDTGELYCWGDGRWDQLGAGTQLAPTPVRVLPAD